MRAAELSALVARGDLSAPAPWRGRIEDYLNKGSMHIGEQQYLAAVRALDKAVQLGPRSWQARFLRGAARLELGRKASAAEDLRAALALGPPAATRATVERLLKRAESR